MNLIKTTSEGIKLLEYKKNLPVGIKYKSNMDLSKKPNEVDLYEYQNLIYKNMFSKSDNLFETPEFKCKTENLIIKDNRYQREDTDLDRNNRI